jgi:hypothetical protein
VRILCDDNLPTKMGVEQEEQELSVREDVIDEIPHSQGG